MVGQRDVALLLAIEARVGQKMVEFEEEGVNVDTRVAREQALKAVGEKKREVIIGIEEGRDVKGNRTRGKLRRLE
jgi:ATP-dependent RNA helicase DDX49/DBP8